MPQAKKPNKDMVGATQGFAYFESNKSSSIKTTAEAQAILGINPNLESMGWWDYNDLATSTTPISVPSTETFVNLTNDGLGPFTNKAYKLSSVTDIWNSTTNRFDFSGLELGDTVDIRLDLQVTTTDPNQDIDIVMELGEGTAGAYQLPFINQNYKTAKAHDVIRFNSIYLGDTNTKDNPALFKIKSDGDADVKVNGWYCRVIKKSM